MNEKANVSKELNAKHRKVSLCLSLIRLSAFHCCLWILICLMHMIRAHGIWVHLHGCKVWFFGHLILFCFLLTSAWIKTSWFIVWFLFWLISIVLRNYNKSINLFVLVIGYMFVCNTILNQFILVRLSL